MPNEEPIQKNEWYKVVDAQEAIQQGDFFYDVPILTSTPSIVDTEIPTAEGSIIEQTTANFNVNCIVMTHSCDFQENTPDDFQVMLCPFFRISKNPSIEDSSAKYLSKSAWGNIAKEHEVDFRILNKFETEDKGLSFFYQIVDLTTTYTIPYGVLKAHRLKQGKRVTMIPPYREWLAQAFANRFMRVGLSQTIDRSRPFDDLS